MRALLALAAMALPAAAADCPVAADLASGIVVLDAEGRAEIFRREGRGMVSSTLPPEGEYPRQRALLGEGVFLVETVDIENGAPVADSRVRYDYNLSGGFRPPRPETEMVMPVVTRDGTGTANESIVYRFGATAPFAIGRCRYDALPVEVDYYDADQVRTRGEALVYLVPLGISVVVGSQAPGEPFETYGVDAIAALP